MWDRDKIIMVLLLFSSLHASALSIQERLHSIPAKDHSDIGTLFRYLLFRSGFAYTCFGDKAISYDCFDLSEEVDRLDHQSPFALNTWKRYAHLFSSENFLFLFHEDLEEQLTEITLINKQAFKNVFDKHREIFASLFGPNMTADELLNLLIKKGSLWNTPMREREDLIGILLGYGEVNARLYQRKAEIIGRKMSAQHLQKVRLLPSEGYHTIDEELAYLRSHLKTVPDENPLIYAIRLPSFVADKNHPQTLAILKKYREQRNCFSKKYEKGNVLEVTLKQLCGDEQ